MAPGLAKKVDRANFFSYFMIGFPECLLHNFVYKVQAKIFKEVVVQ